jgi:type I restriction enzyme M protein
MDAHPGRCAILFPHGVLFRDEEREMRKKIVGEDVIEAVIGLGPNLFYNSPMEACIVICRSRKPAESVGKVLLVDAINEVTRERAQSFLTPDHIGRILLAYQDFADEDGFAAVATLDDIARQNGNLSIPLYVKRLDTAEERDLEEVVAAWRTSASDLRTAAGDLFKLLGAEEAA